MTLSEGIYEEVISEALQAQLDRLSEYLPDRKLIDADEADLILSKYISHVIRRALRIVREGIEDNHESLSRQVEICNQLINLLASLSEQDDLLASKISQQKELLLSLYQRINSARALHESAKAIRPETPLSESTLFTGASVEPNMVSEIKKEILTSDRIDILMSFIRFSGLVLILDELREFLSHNAQRKIRIITTTYMGATEYKALSVLTQITGIEVRMSFNIKRSRLHAKAYLFERETGFSTAYIGSSNLSRSAITNGLEWNVKVSERESFDIIRKFQATFESYWNDSEFEPIDLSNEETMKRVQEALDLAKRPLETNNLLPLFDITPHPFQKEMLAHLEAERTIHGRFRNLLVAATGTGKTVVAAFDYKRFRESRAGSRTRLLFVAHRREILEQSIKTFRVILKDQNFGDLMFSGLQPRQIDHLFISIQTFNSQSFIQTTSPDYYDYIIIDEFHHAPANSYQSLLEYYQPKILLGLTATPERMDNKDTIRYFDHYIASEMRLPEAIDRQLLCPFLYFGVSDSVDYSLLQWRGKYDEHELTNLYTANDYRASLILEKVRQYLGDTDCIRALGFCASQDHARHMNAYFQRHGLRSEVVLADTDQETRRGASKRLRNGTTNFIFTVDLYNEGVDIPEINAVLFLRPTESLTVFLQQLGRGLRNTTEKEHLIVLDFIGQAHREYRFDDKYHAIVEQSRHSLKYQIDQNVFRLPKGCYLQFERQAKEYVLRALDNFRINANNLRKMLSTFTEDTGIPLTLSAFLEHHHLSLEDFYGSSSSKRSFKILSSFENIDQTPAYLDAVKRFRNLFHLNSNRFLNYIIKYIDQRHVQQPDDLDEIEQKLEGMFYYSFYSQAPTQKGFTSCRDGLLRTLSIPFVADEIKEICTYLLSKIDFVDEPVDLGYACPLDLHCQYSRDQIMAGLGELTGTRYFSLQAGVKYIENRNLDLFLINLNKSEKDFSPSTMYEDYAINSRLFHWQSQSSTDVESSVGQRYIHHRKNNHQIILFVREYKQMNGGTSPYIYLGKANYIKHQGSKPISIVWELEKEMPGKLVVKANKSVM